MIRRPSSGRWLGLTVISALLLLVGAALLLVPLTSVPPAHTASTPPAATLPPSKQPIPVPSRAPALTAPADVPLAAPDFPMSDSPPESPTQPDASAVFGTLIAQATGTAAAFDRRATADSATATAESGGSGAVTQVAFGFSVQDRAGALLGDGEVRLFAPARMGLDEAGEIRIEIVVNGSIPGLALTLNPPKTPTPILNPSRSTPTPMALSDRQFIAVREYMGAMLGGADVGHFSTDPVPPDGLRRMQPGAVNWWKWNLRPTGEQALGVNRLEVRIVLPQTLEDGTDISTETNLLPFQIEVVRQADMTPGSLVEGALNLAGLLATLGGALGFVFGLYRLMANRFQRR